MSHRFLVYYILSYWKFPFDDYVYESHNALGFQAADTIVTEIKNRKCCWTNEHIFFSGLEAKRLDQLKLCSEFCFKDCLKIPV